MFSRFCLCVGLGGVALLVPAIATDVAARTLAPADELGAFEFDGSPDTGGGWRKSTSSGSSVAADPETQTQEERVLQQI